MAAARSIADLAGCIDHTLLKPDATASDLAQLCREARAHGFAAVCVNPAWVAACAHALDGTRVRVCAVVGFPLGATFTEVKRDEAARAVALGAREIDMVIHVGALKSGDTVGVERDIAAVVEVCATVGAVCKVIIEAALLTDDEKVVACRLAAAAGAGYVKTSTGFGAGGATTADVALMRRMVGDRMGVKASGGVRDLRTLEAMLDAGASRIGSSAGVAIIREARAAGRPEA